LIFFSYKKRNGQNQVDRGNGGNLAKDLILTGYAGRKGRKWFQKKGWMAAKEALKVTHDIDLKASQLKTKWSNVC